MELTVDYVGLPPNIAGYTELTSQNSATIFVNSDIPMEHIKLFIVHEICQLRIDGHSPTNQPPAENVIIPLFPEKH